MPDRCNLPAGVQNLGCFVWIPSGAPFKAGSCCACGGTRRATAIIQIDRRCLVPGHGWGCVVCRQPPDGASVVLCDGCREGGMLVRFACRGYPRSDGRAPIEEFTEPFHHDLARHPEVGDG